MQGGSKSHCRREALVVAINCALQEPKVLAIFAGGCPFVPGVDIGEKREGRGGGKD